jgi:uncharacterized repeat protein (TIGR01451 family)
MMPVPKLRSSARIFLFASVLIGGVLLALGVIFSLQGASLTARAAPIPPPEGYPKLSLSTKIVTPTLAHKGSTVLFYTIEIRNTGAYKADGVTFVDAIPANTTYNGDAHATAGSQPTFSSGVLNWVGNVGFDSSVLINFSVTISPTFAGEIQNQAVITHPLIPKPVTVSAETIVTDSPILDIKKTSTPSKPGPNKPLTYLISVTNEGQPATGLPITVTDKVPLNTTLKTVGPDGTPAGGRVTWTRTVDLVTGASTVFTYSVNVNNVLSGTVISNDEYQVSSSKTGVVAGEVYTVTVVDPILHISKSISPDPPGSNRAISYTLTVLNTGSLATNLDIQDHLPAGINYVSGGTYSGGVISWTLPKLDTGEFARFTFVAQVPDVAGVYVLNSDYSVCSSEGVCQAGTPLDSLVIGPTFEATAELYPVAKKPGGGTGPVTPTLVINNLGPGNALNATARLTFNRISVGLTTLKAIPNRGTFSSGPSCGSNCYTYFWVGNIGVGEAVTLTTITGQSTIGGDPNTIYSTTVQITDTLGVTSTQEVSATAEGIVTHSANLIPSKSAPMVIGAGQIMTYTLKAYDFGLSTDTPPYPILTDTIPLSTTLVNVSDGGTSSTVNNRTVVSWTLPSMGPGESAYRSYSVLVNSGLVSGTQIVNSDYRATWFNQGGSGLFSNLGEPFTTTVREIGLVDSFKTVSPTLALPGQGNVLTYTVHVVNSSPMNLTGVKVSDLLPWQNSTYQRDAVASAGEIISDIVNVNWTGDVAAFSSESITFTVLVDSDFQGPITNTATITHSTLSHNVVANAVAYITDKPVLRISKTASPNPVKINGELLYSLKLNNLGQRATSLVVTDTLPANVTYVPGTASSSGQLVGNQVRWEFPVLAPLEERTLSFRVKVLRGLQVENNQYGVACAEGESASGAPVITQIYRPNPIFLPFISQ